MAFLNDLTRGLKVTGQTVAQKTKEIGETVQIKSQINTEKETITRLYAAIGKQIFESGNEEAEKKFFTEFASINKAMKKIAELEAEHQMVAHQTIGAEQAIDYASNRYI